MPRLSNITSLQASASTASGSDMTTLNFNMDIDTAGGPTPAQFTNTVLLSEKADHQKEHDDRLRNGNIVRHKQYKVGKKQDTLIHRLVIERVGVKANGLPCPIYYCIGCDEDVKNIARDRSLPHAYSCMVSALSRD